MVLLKLVANGLPNLISVWRCPSQSRSEDCTMRLWVRQTGLSGPLLLHLNSQTASATAPQLTLSSAYD